VLVQYKADTIIISWAFDRHTKTNKVSGGATCLLTDCCFSLEVYIVIAHRNNSPWVDMMHHTDTLCVVYVGQKLTRWWWCLLCTGPTRWVAGLYSPSSLKQQSVSRHVAQPDTLFFVYVDQKLTRWWWCLLFTGPTRWVGGLYSPSSTKQTPSLSSELLTDIHNTQCVRVGRLV
jgi:hypothetical protein